MPIRWLIGPVTESTMDGTTYREPKINTLLDPGRLPDVRGYRHSSIVHPTFNWCLSFVRGVDFTPVDADPSFINLLETDYEDNDGKIMATVQDLGWSAAKRNRVLQRLIDKGVDTTGLTLSTPLWQIVLRLCQTLSPGFTLQHLQRTWVK